MSQPRLRRLRVRGFKSLADFDLDLHDDLSIIIGPNGAGKSSVLQALAFVRYFASGKPESFFEDRRWRPSDLRTHVKTASKQPLVQFQILLESGEIGKIYWEFSWDYQKGKSGDEVIFFALKDENVNFIPALPNLRHVQQEATGIPILSPNGSMLAILSLDSLDTYSSDIAKAVYGWAKGTYSLELLSPTAMRQGDRGSSTDIGPRGERLAGFLASLSPVQKDRIVRRLAQFYPIQNVETTRKRAGWVDLRVAEAFEGQWRTGASHMSDGFMRLLGLASIPEFSEAASIVLLDEVEDGIDPHILPRFIEMIARESKAQLLLTSHSPVLVNAFEPSQIAFVARQPDGRTIAASFADIEPLKEGLEYFGPGEVWTNTDMHRIVELVRATHNSRQQEPDRRPKYEQVKSFMDLSA